LEIFSAVYGINLQRLKVFFAVLPVAGKNHPLLSKVWKNAEGMFQFLDTSLRVRLPGEPRISEARNDGSEAKNQTRL